MDSFEKEYAEGEGGYEEILRRRRELLGENIGGPSFAEINIIYPFIDRHMKTGSWTRQADSSFLLVIGGKNNVLTVEDGELLVSRWDG